MKGCHCIPLGDLKCLEKFNLFHFYFLKIYIELLLLLTCFTYKMIRKTTSKTFRKQEKTSKSKHEVRPRCARKDVQTSILQFKIVLSLLDFFIHN